MDNLTHTLTGIAISYAGFNRKTRYATLAIVIGANLPDGDIVASIWGNATYLKYHRGISHSIPGAVVLGLALAGAVYLLGRRSLPKKSGPALKGGWLVFACLAATGSHLLLDLTNSYGIRLLLPFNSHWYAWDIESIIDPLLWFILAAGLGLSFLFRLITEEVGARKTDFRPGAITALCAMVSLWGLRGIAHRRALNLLAEYDYHQKAPERLGAFPSPFNPFEWTGVVETESAYYVLPINLFGENLDLDAARVFPQLESSPELQAALRTRTAQIFMDFARFPLARSMPADEGGSTVMIRDLRYQPADFKEGGFAVKIELDKQLNVRSEAFSFSGRFRNN